jgi:hypothetical protein
MPETETTYDAAPGMHVVRWTAVPAMPARLGLIAGDFVGNARASLDHPVYGLSGVSSPDPKGTGLPDSHDGGQL